MILLFSLLLLLFVNFSLLFERNDSFQIVDFLQQQPRCVLHNAPLVQSVIEQNALTLEQLLFVSAQDALLLGLNDVEAVSLLHCVRRVFCARDGAQRSIVDTAGFVDAPLIDVARRRTLLCRPSPAQQRQLLASAETCGAHGFAADGRCHCVQDGAGHGWFGRQCQHRFEEACDRGVRGGVSILGECHCHAGYYGARCEQRCERVAQLRACASLNGAWAHANAHAHLAALDERVGALQLPDDAARAVCGQAARRWLCHHNARDTRVRIAFYVMLHNTRRTWGGNRAASSEPSSGLQLARWLLDSVWRAEHTFALHVDPRAPPGWLLDVHTFVRQRGYDNVFFVPTPRVVVWSGASVVHAFLDGVRFLLGRRRAWDVLINLSGADVALRTPHELQTYLFARQHHNMVWANYFDAIDSGLRETQLGTTFATCWAQRKVIKLAHYRKTQRTWFMPVKGQFWGTLTRSFCEYLFSDDRRLHRFLRYLALGAVPDEKLIPTMLVNSPFQHKWFRIMDRYIQWESHANHPKMLNESDWPALTSNRFIFARKASFTHSKQLLARLMIRLQNKRQQENE